MQQISVVKVTIASGQSLSPAVELTTEQLVGVQLPAGWTAADMTFQGSYDGVTYGDVFTQTGEYKIPSASLAASQHVILSPVDTASFRFVKVRSGVTGAAVAQLADRVITLLIRALD